MKMKAQETIILRAAEIAHKFALYGDFLEIVPYGSGHINDTFSLTLSQAGVAVRYIIQRINKRVFNDIPSLMDNIQRVTAHVASRLRQSGDGDVSRKVLTLVSARDGMPFVTDEFGDFWRCYLFIEKARTYDIVENPGQAFAAAKAFGEFQRCLAGMETEKRLCETIPCFHDTRKRFDALVQAIEKDLHNRAARVKEEIAFALARRSMAGVLLELMERGKIPERITHNDTKFNNIMIDDATQEGVCVIDLDTVMPGLSLYDFGDMVRSVTNSAREDERDLSLVSMRMPYYEQLLKGFLSTAGEFLNETERAHLAFSGKLLSFETGIRFLTDYLQGDVYFKTHRPEQNLDRCRTQFKLVQSMEAQESKMNALLKEI